MQNTSLKDSILKDLAKSVYSAPFNIADYHGSMMYTYTFMNYVMLRCFVQILNDSIEINEYGEISRYMEKLVFTVIEDTDGCLFLQSITYNAKPSACVMVARALKNFLTKHNMWNNIDKVFDFKKRQLVNDRTKSIKNNTLDIGVLNMQHIAMYKQNRINL